MTVSSDPRGRGVVRRVAIPEVLGLHVDDAKIVLSNAGFEKTKVHFTEDYVDEHSVVDQFPRPGMLIARDVEVQLRVNRMSLVQYLPQVYQQEALDGASWLKGFLYIIQSVYDGVSRRLDNVHDLFDPRTTDPDFLPWLASWLAISLNPDWSTLQRRQMLMAAARLFPDRGTAKAIREFVRIYAAANVEIEENAWPFQGFRIGVNSTVGDDTVILPPMNLAHCFVVRLDKPASGTREDEIIKIHQIIQSQKPAHTSYFLAFSDEAESGVMGTFMSIGMAGPEGEGAALGIGIGIGMDGTPFGGVEPGQETSGLLYTEAEGGTEDDDAPADGAAKRPKTTLKKTPLTRSTEPADADRSGTDNTKTKKRETPKE